MYVHIFTAYTHSLYFYLTKATLSLFFFYMLCVCVLFGRLIVCLLRGENGDGNDADDADDDLMMLMLYNVCECPST